MKVLRGVQVAGSMLAAVMLLLMAIDTGNPTTFVIWGVLAMVAWGVAGLARWAEEEARRRQRDEDFRRHAGPGR